MKLHENQLGLIRLLCLVNIMNYEDCLKMLDTENTGDMTAMSYAFRPLTKNGYVSKISMESLPFSKRDGSCFRIWSR